MKPAVARESALARGRVAGLNTNRPARVRRGHASGLQEIRTTLRDRWGDVVRQGWSAQDLLAGLTVATVAIPLNVALAIAAGLPPSTGLIAGAVGGLVSATFGGSNYQVSGPAAALNVMVFALVARFGAGGAAAAALVSGVVGLVVGVLGYGKLANLLPKIVLAGFTTGVGLKLLDQQVPILLGTGTGLAAVVVDFWSMAWLREVDWLSVVCGLTVAWITVGLAHLKSFPSSLLGILIATFVAYELGWQIPRVGTVDLRDVALALPRLAEGTSWVELAAMALPLALLSCAESLISAKAVDEMSGHKSGYAANAELFGQGLGNLASGLLGGMPVSGVIVRSSVGLQSGARTRMTAIYHGVLLAIAAYCFGETLALIPVSALAGLLVVIAWRLIKIKLVVDVLRHHRLHAIAFLASAIGTLLGHLITGLALGCAAMYVDHVLDRALARRRASRATAVIRPSPTIRAVVSHTGAPLGDQTISMRDQAVWHRQVRTQPRIHASAFVHPTASIIGWVELGREVNVAADTSIRADEGAPFYIGDRSNVQDGVVIHALKEKWVVVEGRQWAVYIGSDVSLAHQALVHGPCLIGARSFIGFKAIVHDAIVGEGCFIGLGAVVAGVELPPRKRVPNGWVVDDAAKVAELPDVEDAHAHFNEDVVQVNRGLVMAYSRHAEAGGLAAAITGERVAPRALFSLKPL